MARLHIPYHLPQATGFSRDDAAEMARIVREHREDAPFREIFRSYGGRSNMVGMGERHDLVLEVHGKNDFDTYHSTLISVRMQNWMDAQMLGHVLMHYTPKEGERYGMQVATHSHPDFQPEKQATFEALWFATELMMPEEKMRRIYAEHGSRGFSIFFEAPMTYLAQRAERLGIIQVAAAA